MLRPIGVCVCERERAVTGMQLLILFAKDVACSANERKSIQILVQMQFAAYNHGFGATGCGR